MTNIQNKDYKGFIILGVDPGFKGGLSFLNPSDMSVASYPMPVIKGTKTRLDTGKIISLIEDYNPIHLVVEKNQARPGQGVSSSFTFGYWSGYWEGLSAGYLMPLTLVPPQVWMKDIFSSTISGIKSSTDYCTKLWPKNDWRGTARSRIIHDGKTDSACLALYLWRKLKKDAKT